MVFRLATALVQSGKLLAKCNFCRLPQTLAWFAPDFQTDRTGGAQRQRPCAFAFDGEKCLDRDSFCTYGVCSRAGIAVDFRADIVAAADTDYLAVADKAFVGQLEAVDTLGDHSRAAAVGTA